MRNKIFILLCCIFASLLSGALLVLAFPRYDLGWLAWVGLVPLLLVISGKSPKQSFFLALCSSFIFFPGVFSWVLEVRGYKLTHHTILGLYLGSYFALFGLVFSLISKRISITAALLSAPFIWVSLEYIRSNLSFLGLPMALLGHSQYPYPLILQFASFTGAYGISFLIVLINATFTAAILTLFHRNARYSSADFQSPSRRATITTIWVSSALIGLVLLYGQMVISAPINRKEINVSVLQGNIPQEIKWDQKYVDFIMQTYVDLSNKASQEMPALIVWPEAATPGFVLKRMDLLEQVKSLIRQTKTYYLIGSAEYPKFSKAQLNSDQFGNTALFFSPNGKLLGQYLKNRLVPFKEYIPYEGIIPWPQFIAPKGKKKFGNQGRDIILFELDRNKFAVSICWESLFPGLFRKFVNQGADFILNITSEASFGESAFPHQFMVINLFRAVENRIWIARAANTGISCFIDPYGRITGRIVKDNKDIFVKGYLTQKIYPSQKRTFYTIYGDIFAYTAIIITVLMLILSFLKVRRS